MKYLKIFTDFLDVTTELGDGAMGRLFRAMLRYARDGAVPEMKGKAAVAWAVARQHMDREAEAYEAKVSGMERARSAKKQIETKQRSMPESLISREDKDKDKEKDKDKDKESVIRGLRPLYPRGIARTGSPLWGVWDQNANTFSPVTSSSRRPTWPGIRRRIISQVALILSSFTWPP